ncbi:Asp-tRNA(Asn)/Glu-tRNA(Gln) amidotransferase subunit GatC [Candidatus Roizmanbacteria bacterium]|nr:Asp-tRNA(Asn)/Glu-tRNA(Gln) amidotransferase subunit GatC [Candidatus Roizmanbacteria bacterium]
MKKISEEDVKRLAKLANLKLSRGELNTYSKQLTSILEYVDQLNEVDTSNIPSTSSTAGLENVSRHDEASNKQKIKELKHLKIVNKNGKNYFLVKRIL